MRRESYIITVGMFMMFLIVLMPIDAASAMAASIDSVEVYGKDSVPGYRAQQDSTIVKVGITAQDVVTPIVKILEDPTSAFDCSVVDAAAKMYVCIHTYAEIPLGPDVGLTPLTVQIYDDSGNPVSAIKKGEVLVDALPPKVTDLTYRPLPGGVVDASYTVQDFACSKSACSGKCAGVASVKFTVAGLDVGSSVDIKEGCDPQTVKTNLTGLVVGADVQSKHICVEATDKFGQGSTTCSDVIIDTDPPKITEGKLVDINGKEIKYSTGTPIGGMKLLFTVVEDSNLSSSIGPNILKVDASSLTENPDEQKVYSELQAPCTQNGKNYECSITGIKLTASASKSLSVRIEAQDGYGNVLDEPKSFSIAVDNVPPKATRMYSGLLNDKGTSIVREDNNTILMDITEATSGMSKKYALLDFGSFGPQNTTAGSSTEAWASECVAGWTCKWFDVILQGKKSGDTVSAVPLTGSADDAGNAMQPTTGSFFVDIDVPIVDKILANRTNITAMGETHPPMSLITGGDMIEIHLFVMDHSGIKSAAANFSEIIDSGPEAVLGDCEENPIIAGSGQRIYECIWTAGPVKEGYLGPLADNSPTIKFSFEDYALHIGTYDLKGLEILERENVTTPSWEITPGKVTPSQGIDRLTWALSNPRVFFPMLFKGKANRNPIPLSVKLSPQGCTGLDYVNANPVTNDFAISLMNFPLYASMPSPPLTDVLEIDLNPGAVPPVNYTDEKKVSRPLLNFTINCTITIQSIVTTGKKRALSLPEDVNVSFVIPVFNNKMGQNIGNAAANLESMKSQASGTVWDILTTLRKIFKVIEQICSMLKSLITLKTGVLDPICDVLTYVNKADTTGASDAAQQGCAFATDGLGKSVFELVEDIDYACSLFIACKVSKEAKDKQDKACNGKNGIWCTIQKAWAAWNSLLADTIYGDAVSSLGLNTVTIKGESLLNAKQGFDPKQSIISSVVTLCIPGIIYNIEKYRQLLCKKILCYRIDVAGGRDPFKCDMAFDYETCTFFWGQVFAAIPMAQYFSKIGTMITDIIKNPYTVIGLIPDKLCSAICSAKGKAAPGGCTVCDVLQWASTLFNLVQDLAESTGTGFQMATYDMCSEALKPSEEESSYDNIKPPVPPAGTKAAGG